MVSSRVHVPHAGGLAATALVNIAFGMSSSYPLLLMLWGLNGLLQVHPSHSPSNSCTVHLNKWPACHMGNWSTMHRPKVA
jgi:sugar phosphate permease